MSIDGEISEKKYQKLYESLSYAVEHLESENTFLKGQIDLLQAEKKQWQLDKAIQQDIIQRTLNTSNATNNQYLEENKALKEEINKLRNR